MEVFLQRNKQISYSILQELRRKRISKENTKDIFRGLFENANIAVKLNLNKLLNE
jgi:SOS response regulatory protein OraA/RecX